jgi:glycosyltransferase involved in cell wall biosynthesis
MKIGIMLRHLTDTLGGVVGYSHNLLQGFLRQGPEHHYHLFYASQDRLGSYAQHSNVTEHVLNASNKFIWDQWQMPRAAKALELDIIFNPKLSVPLFSSVKRVFVLRPEQFTQPELFPWFDRRYFKFFIPRYCRASARVIAPTEQARQDIIQYVGVSPKRMVTVHEACGEHFFAPPLEGDEKRVREKYELPQRFVLFVGALTPLKNFERLVEAFAQVQPKHDLKLVVVGFGRWKFEEDVAFAQKHAVAEHLHFPGFVDDEDLPAVYRMAECLFFPSIYEGFGIPICEAHATGCAVVTTKRGCCPEVAGEAAELVDPFDVSDMARGLDLVLSDKALRERLVSLGRERVQHFRFDRCARETLQVFASALKG